MSLTVTHESLGTGGYVLSPEGSLDSNTAPILEERVDFLLQQAPTVLVLDLARLHYISSAGIRVILKAKSGMKKLGSKVVFMNLQPQIEKVFSIINAIPSMTIFSSVEELDDYLDAMQRS